MKYYYQTKFKAGKDVPPEEQGDCWATAIACMLGWSPYKRDELNRYITEASIEGNGGWFNTTVGMILLETRGEIGLYFQNILTPEFEMPENMFGDFLVVEGDSPRGDWGHAVLWHKEGHLEWDPHPSGDGLASDIQDINYLVNLVQ